MSFKKSLQLDANADEAHHQLSMVYSHVGLLDAAQEHVKTAVGLNPNNTMARFRLGVYTAWQCRFEEALAVLKTVPSDVSPMLIDRVRAEVLVQIGRLDDARDIVDEYLRHHPTDEGGSFTSMKALLFAKGRPASTSRADDRPGDRDRQEFRSLPPYRLQHRFGLRRVERNRMKPFDGWRLPQTTAFRAIPTTRRTRTSRPCALNRASLG